MIYTTYLSKLKNIPDNAIKIFIARRSKPVIQDTLKKYNCIWYKDFGPSKTLHDELLNHEIPFMLFEARYIVEQFKLRNINQTWNNYITTIKEADKQGKDIYLICYEKDDNECHRKAFRQIVTLLTDIESKEADFNENSKSC